MPVEKKRIQLPNIGFYLDLLKYDAFLCGKSIPQQAASLVCARLMNKEPEIERRLEYVAKKMDLSLEQLKSGILKGTIKSEDISAMDQEEDSD